MKKPALYRLPLRIGALMHKKEHPACTLQQSVGAHLHLLLTTSFGEIAADESFGCAIWDHDFDNISNGHKQKEYIRQSILQTIYDYEKRLDHVRVELLVGEEEVLETVNRYQIKKRIDIDISGILQLTNEKFTYKDSFLVGPLSY